MKADKIVARAGDLIAQRTVRQDKNSYATLVTMDPDGSPVPTTISPSRSEGIRWVTFCTGRGAPSALRLGENPRAAVCFNSPSYHISLTGTAENGISVFPAVVSVDNPDGLIMSNSYADYSFVASESDNCLVVPVNAVKYVSFANVPGIEDLIASGPTGDDSNGIGGMDGMGEMDGSFPQGGEPMPGGGDMTLPEGGDQPVDGDMTLPEGGDQPVDGDTLPDDGGEPMDDSGLEPATDGNAVTLPADGGDVAIPVPEQYTSGVFAQPLREVFVGGNGEVVTIVGGGSSSSSGGSSSSVGGSSSGSAISDDGTGYIVFVRAPEAPENAILEPDPAWECPEGFWAVPVVTGLSNTTQVEIISGLNEGDEIFIGYASNSGGSWG